MTLINPPEETRVRCTPVERDRDGGDTVKEEERDECRQTRRGVIDEPWGGRSVRR